ncbi:DctP family TRAP transporter solute-binding subunit [Oceanobacillus sp. AG]|uniref:DctP family TRAP transporter solute-binding subunit n=1 Tax=Oceanobacillus sp. AG TaxID=2681969 RepID=UPI0012EC5DE5|nr:DctP family TRAP transporter solute-binding subunit [Oceanobacillus sp. AG]
MKKILGLAVLFLMMLVVSACGSSDDASADPAADGGEKYNLQMSVTVNDSSTWYKAAEKLAEDISEETDGRISIDVFPNEQLSGGDSGQTVEMLSNGSIDLTFNSTIIYSVLDERLGVASAPFLFRNHEEVDKVFNGDGGDALVDILREIGVEPLGYGENGFRQLTNSVHEIASPEDLKGLKIRIPGMTMYIDLFRAFGSDPSTMTFAEVFTALQQHTIDGQENPIDVIHSSRLDEVQDYMTMWNYSYDPLVLGINKELYDSMSQEDQELFSRLGEEAAAYQVELARELEAEQIEELEERGIQLYYPTDEELDAFTEAVQDIYDKYEDVWGADLLEAFRP